MNDWHEHLNELRRRFYMPHQILLGVCVIALILMIIFVNK